MHSSSHDDVYHTLFEFKLDYYNRHERSLIQKFTRDHKVCKILKGRASSPIKIMSYSHMHIYTVTVKNHFYSKINRPEKATIKRNQHSKQIYFNYYFQCSIWSSKNEQ